MNRKLYEDALKKLQQRILLLQTSYRTENARGVVVLEGWDAAGKGGIIRRLSWAMDPRSLRVYPISAPDAHEAREHWLQRFWRKVPQEGEIAVFDRSWYGRVLVERVEDLARPEAWKRAYGEIKQFEKQLLAEDFRIVKLFIDITPETQLERFKRRLDHPEKRWKLTSEDIRNRAKWDAYTAAYEDMVRETSHRSAEWNRIDGNDKHAARLTALEAIIDGLGRGLKQQFPEAAPEAVEFLSNT